jgi:hypothetical protein
MEAICMKGDLQCENAQIVFPPALKYGIYSGLGLLPTESRVKFRKFRKQLFAELNLVGPMEQGIGEEIVRLEWRRRHLDTYDLAERARARCRAIRSELIPEVRYLDPPLLADA